MSHANTSLTAEFVQQQRERLLELHANLQAAAGTQEDEEALLKEGNAEVREYEDDAQKLDALELEGNLVVRSRERLARVERALEKIEQGSYGVSDVSGSPIARERLTAVPEAICTLAEEASAEA